MYRIKNEIGDVYDANPENLIICLNRFEGWLIAKTQNEDGLYVYGCEVMSEGRNYSGYGITEYEAFQNAVGSYLGQLRLIEPWD